MPKKGPVGGITCCLSAAALYYLGRRSGNADIMKSVNQLEDLDVAALVISVSCENVRSDTPVTHEYSGSKGVIVSSDKRKTLTYDFSCEQTSDSKDSYAAAVAQDFQLSYYKELVEYVEDAFRFANAVGSRRGTRMALQVGNEAYEKSGLSTLQGSLDYIQTLKMLGMNRIKRVLPTGAPFIIVGEAVKDDTGPARFQQPHKGPFYVCRKTIDHVIANLGKWSRTYKYASTGFTVFGVCLLAKHAFECFMERRRHFETRKRIHDAAAKRAARAEGDDDADNGPTICVLCLEQEYNSVFVPCGHICCCMACSSSVKKCPMCQNRIDEVTRP